MFRMKNTSAKTVPLDQCTSSSSDKVTDLPENNKNLLSSSNSAKPKWKIRKILFPSCKNSSGETMPFREVIIPVPLEKETTEETEQGSEQNNNTLENRASLDRPHHGDTNSKAATCRKRLSFRRKIDAIRTGSNQPGSPPDVVVKSKPKPARTTGVTTITTNTSKAAAAAAAAKLSHSVSMPVPTRDQKLRANRVLPKKTRQDGGDRSSNVMVNKFDPIVGMSVMVVTLIIMLIWGRLCAILCTSAWLYFVPRLRSLKRDDRDRDDHDAVMETNGGDLDLNSVEYKKRVVLEGFLERDHNNNHRIAS